ncbi:MAG: hypothetical protein G8D61_09020 [gamma proteobacterium symbiont of Ctena orbiculata]
MSEGRSTLTLIRAYDKPVQFGFRIAPEVDAHLQRAARLVTHREASLAALIDAREAAPGQVETLVAMFKLLFYQGKIAKAESLVRESLTKAALQGGFPSDWHQLDRDSAQWREPRGPARLYLYSLKALAFIRLRQDDREGAREILDTIALIDPEDNVGANVIRELHTGIERDDRDG